jgi:integrase
VAIRLLLAVAPVRVSTLALTTCGKHLQVTPSGIQGNALLKYDPTEVKNKVGLTFNVDPASAQVITDYMTNFRPRLEYGDPGAIFPGEAGPTKRALTLAQQITKTIRDHTGLKFNVHLFRHFAGYVYLRKHPGDYETVRRLLGHKDIATTMNSYVWMDTETAIKRYQENILGILEGLK